MEALERLGTHRGVIDIEGYASRDPRTLATGGVQTMDGEIIGGIVTGAGVGAIGRAILGRVAGALGGLLGRGGTAVGRAGSFTSRDIALGVHEHLAAFRGGARIGTDFPTPNGLWNAITNGIDSVVASGGRIRFNLNGVDVRGAFNPSSSVYNTYTSRELRYVLSRHANSTVFYQNGGVVPAP